MKKKTSGGAISTLAEFIAADLTVLPGELLSFVYTWKFWTGSTQHLEVGFFDDMRNRDDDFNLLERVGEESRRRQGLPKDQRPPEHCTDDPRAFFKPPPNDVVAKQQAEVRAAWLVHKERIRAQMEAQLAEMLQSLTDEETSELQRLVQKERETVAKKDGEAVQKQAAEEEEHRQRMAEFDRQGAERGVKRRQKRLAKTMRAEKRKRLGIEDDESDSDDDE
ncbi:hypothetical protein MCOR31_010417 [Pyricularia oryzae]|nr:hypothetical protein MCOR31_010417 [Pyricularia oryzae]KAI6431744.1 hypothetical protein MCOR21_003786 [Pyricularia oryzae]